MVRWGEGRKSPLSPKLSNVQLWFVVNAVSNPWNHITHSPSHPHIFFAIKPWYLVMNIHKQYFESQRSCIISKLISFWSLTRFELGTFRSWSRWHTNAPTYHLFYISILCRSICINRLWIESDSASIFETKVDRACELWN